MLIQACMIHDERNQKRYFGAIYSPTVEEKKAFGITDEGNEYVIIGDNVNRVCLPRSALSIFPNRIEPDFECILCEKSITNPEPLKAVS